MNTLNSLSKKSGAKHWFEELGKRLIRQSNDEEEPVSQEEPPAVTPVGKPVVYIVPEIRLQQRLRGETLGQLRSFRGDRGQ